MLTFNSVSKVSFMVPQEELLGLFTVSGPSVLWVLCHRNCPRKGGGWGKYSGPRSSQLRLHPAAWKRGLRFLTCSMLFLCKVVVSVGPG